MKKKLFIFFAIIGFTTITMAQDSRVSKSGLYKPTANEKAREYYNDAHEKFEIQDYEQAISLYKKAIQEDSNYIDAYDNLGLSYRKLNLLDSAELYYKLSIEKYPQGIAAIQNMAVIYNIRGDFKSADHYYQLIIESEPENPEGYYGMSKSAYFQGKYADALLNAQLAEKYYLMANSPIVYLGDNYYLKSRIYYSMKDIKAARKYLELAKSNGIDVDPEFEKALK